MHVSALLSRFYIVGTESITVKPVTPFKEGELQAEKAFKVGDGPFIVD